MLASPQGAGDRILTMVLPLQVLSTSSLLASVYPDPACEE
jgi:hypothetical protein